MGPPVVCPWLAGLPSLGSSRGQSEPLDSGPGLGGPVALAARSFPIALRRGQGLPLHVCMSLPHEPGPEDVRCRSKNIGEVTLCLRVSRARCSKHGGFPNGAL